MNCGFCGKPFDEDRSQPACRACPVGAGCGLVRCPHCGYENPGTPGWIAFLKERLGARGSRGEALVPDPTAQPKPAASRRGTCPLPMLGPEP